MQRVPHVYILSSHRKRLYIGITTKLAQRIFDHKHKTHPDCFTARYNIDRLVYIERFDQITTAIAREKELKGWTRLRKVALIVTSNPTWIDLSQDWGKPIELRTMIDSSTASS